MLEFRGRLDGQIKIRGFRIEPAEIEARLAAHPSVKRCVVVAKGIQAGEKRLVAYYVPVGNEPEDSESFREFLIRDLPEYVIPSAFVALPEGLPLTANGKIDARALPDPAQTPGQSPQGHVKPRNALEGRLCRLWEETLERNSFGVTDNFFELGGDSLRGLRLFAKIEREFGRSLPLGTLFSAPTVEKMALVLNAARSEWPSLIVPIQPHGWKRPFFCVHGGDGGVVFYKTMVDRLGNDRPVYGIEAPLLTNSGLLRVEQSVEKTAESYLSALRQVQPKGPYLLSGYSFGGLVAYDIARQLRRAGEEVSLLALFDTDNPAAPPKYFGLGKRLSVRWQIDAEAGRSVPGRLAHLGVRIKSGLLTRARQKQAVAIVRAHAEMQMRAPVELRPVEVREAHAKLMAAYRPAPYDGRMVLFRCSDKNDKFEHTRALGWEDLVQGGIDIIDVPGLHLDLFKGGNANVLSDKLKKVLDTLPV